MDLVDHCISSSESRTGIERELSKDMPKLERKLGGWEGRSRGISGRMEARAAQCARCVCMWEYQRYLHLKGDPFQRS